MSMVRLSRCICQENVFFALVQNVAPFFCSGYWQNYVLQAVQASAQSIFLWCLCCNSNSKCCNSTNKTTEGRLAGPYISLPKVSENSVVPLMLHLRALSVAQNFLCVLGLKRQKRNENRTCKGTVKWSAFQEHESNQSFEFQGVF